MPFVGLHRAAPVPGLFQRINADFRKRVRAAAKRACGAWPPRPRPARAAFAFLAALTLAGCEGPLSTLSPAGPAAAMIAVLWWAMLGFAALICLLVFGLIFFSWHARSPGPRTGFWIWGAGVGFTLLVLSLAVGAGLWVGEQLQRPGTAPPPRITAEAKQWEWSFLYQLPTGEQIRLPRLYIPAGGPVDIEVTSLDVVHSFWVPQLAGKMDALPGRSNIIRIEASRPGRYDGLSAEFSGRGYSGMRFEVIAYPPGQLPAELRPAQRGEGP